MKIHPRCSAAPLVALGVEGVLDPHPSRYRRRAAAAGLSSYTTHTVHIPQPWPEAAIPWEVRVNPDHGSWVRDLASRGLELVLQPTFPCTAELYCSKFHVEARIANLDMFGGDVPGLANARPLLWILPRWPEHSHGRWPAQEYWADHNARTAADRSGFGWPTLLIETDPYTGLTPAEMTQADAWLTNVASLQGAS